MIKKFQGKGKLCAKERMEDLQSMGILLFHCFHFCRRYIQIYAWIISIFSCVLFGSSHIYRLQYTQHQVAQERTIKHIAQLFPLYIGRNESKWKGVLNKNSTWFSVFSGLWAWKWKATCVSLAHYYYPRVKRLVRLEKYPDTNCAPEQKERFSV